MMSATSPDSSAGSNGAANATLADPIAEGRRVVAGAGEKGVVLRLLGGVAIVLQAPHGKPLLTREIKDIDVVTPRGNKKAVAQAFQALGYVDDEMFNAFPIAERLHHEPLTVPLAELLLTKLQIVELNERDERDIYNLCFHHEISSAGEPGIEGSLIGDLCARDWGLWRTCKGTIERCRTDLVHYALGASERDLIDARLAHLWDVIEAAPKTSKWRWRANVGERKRWYEEPEEEGQPD